VRAQLLGHAHVVRAIDDGRAGRACRSRTSARNLGRGLRVEVAGRLVGEQDGRVDDNARAIRHALAPPPTLVGQMLQRCRVYEIEELGRCARVDLAGSSRGRCSGSRRFEADASAAGLKN